MAAPDDQETTESVSSESMEFVHESVTSTGQTSDKITDRLPFDDKDFFHAVAGIQRAG